MKYLAVDVGGSSTRAAIFEEDGRCIGFGKAGSGNPTSFDTATAVTAILDAAQAAIAKAGSKLGDLAGGVVGIAGAAGDTGPPLRVELIRAGLPERLQFESDLLVTYQSGSLAPEGYALVAGTGAAAVRIRGGRIEATCDGLGWLLGDGGSGFWIGHRAVLAATSSLDDRGPPTVLGDLVLSRLGVERTSERGPDGRLVGLRRAVDAVYRLRPVELASFAPLAFEAEALGDDVGCRIVAEAGTPWRPRSVPLWCRTSPDRSCSAAASSRNSHQWHDRSCNPSTRLPLATRWSSPFPTEPLAPPR